MSLAVLRRTGFIFVYTPLTNQSKQTWGKIYRNMAVRTFPVYVDYA